MQDNKPFDTPLILRTNPTDDLCSTHTPYLILTRFEFLLFLVTFDNVGWGYSLTPQVLFQPLGADYTLWA